MRKAGFICCLAAVLSEAGSAHAGDLPPTMSCEVSGHAGCNGDDCVGAGIKDPSIKLKISRSFHTLLLNGISGSIDEGNGDPYADGNHNVRWKWGAIAFTTYRLNQPEPGRVFLTLHRDGSELEFHCLGSLFAKD
jgi:hypothetical protein